MKEHIYHSVIGVLLNVIADLCEKYPEVMEPLPESIKEQNARILKSDAMQAFHHAAMLIENLTALIEKSAPPESDTAEGHLLHAKELQEFMEARRRT